MSSDNSINQITLASAIAPNFSFCLKDKKPILPFTPGRLPYNWSPGSQQVTYCDLNHYQAIEEYCPLDQIITVECGIKIHSLEQYLTKNKQWLPIAYADQETTLLDVILTGNAGPMEVFTGGLRRNILGLTYLLSNGLIGKTG